MRIAVCVPFYNEEKGISTTLDALLKQGDQNFTVFFCDNNSTDGSPAIVRDFIAANRLDWKLVTEEQKGTGAAADTAMRAAAAAGFDVLARTDADAIPQPNWIAQIRAAFAESGTRMISGITLPIRSEVTAGQYWLYRAAGVLASVFGTLRLSNYGAGTHGIYVMTNGNNLAIKASTYLEVGGFPRSRIEDLHEDRALVNAVRVAGYRVQRVRGMRVAVSSRRVKAWGLANSLRWYKSHFRPTENVDIR
jgi:glycosyltransferase involved in cell wall biosynthesis